MVNSLDIYLKALLIHAARGLKKIVNLLCGFVPCKLNLLNLVAWISIAFQLLFPLSIAFSPAIAAAISKQTVIATEPYIIGPGENTLAVAKKYHLSLDELKKLNQFRSFARPFDQLAVGDEIDVPLNVADLSANKPAPATADATRGAAGEMPFFNTQQRSRDYMSSFGSNNAVGARASTDQNGAAAAAMVRSAAGGEISQTAQQWLSQFGTARVQLNVDDDFHLDGSALDLLIPLYDKPHEMFFTQWGARNKDSRNTINIGAGARTWQGNWMYGMNAFYDEDVTAHNSRIGMGLEAWRDYLKLSANNYVRISDWRDSRDLEDYKERPANGYDIRAEAYLPAYPQLGGKLVFEQYRGDNVALFGKDNLQKDPYAFTLGMNYTPISLMTVGIDHREGKGSMNDTTFIIQMNYRLGASWQSQISPDAVAATRTLAGTRYDLVDRNNNIVLQYQKQQVLQLRLPEQLTGHEGEQITITAQVTSKYAVDRIDWDTSAIIAAGGTVTQVGQNTITILLPPYQHNANATNIYTINAVAYDIRKNASNTAASRIEVLPTAAQIGAGNLTVTADNALANGSAQNAVRAVVTDAQGNPVAGQTVTFSANNGATVHTVIGTTGPDGVATATLTNTAAGTTVVTATLNGTNRSVNTTFIADTGTAQIATGNLTVTTNNATANGIAANAVRALVTDAHGNPLSGQTVTFTATNGATVTTVIGTTGPDGVATATLTNTAAGISAVTAALTNGSSQTADTTFTGDAGTAHIAAGNLTVTANNAAANGSAQNAVRALVTDAHGNPVAGQTVTFTATNGATVTTVIGITGPDGVATATLTNTVTGISAVTAALSNGSSQTADTTFIADSGTAQIADGNLTVTSNNAAANGIAANAVRALVTDAHGNPLAGQAVTFTATNGATVTTVIGTTGPDGVATASLTNTAAGISTVTAALSNGSSKTADTTFTADSGTAQIATGNLTVTANNAVANGIAANAVRALVTDAHGNPLAGQTVTFTATNGAIIAPLNATTGADGVATATLTNTTAGTSAVTAALANGNNKTVDTTFIADTGTAQIAAGNLTVTVNNAAANGSAQNAVRALVTDAHGNPLAGQTVTFTATNGATVTTVIGTTGPDGIATATLTSDTVGISVVTATLTNGNHNSVDVTFDAALSIGGITLTADNATADGRETNIVEVTVVDGNGQPAAGVEVTLTASNSTGTFHVVTPASARTDAAGKISIEYAYTLAGALNVVATIAGTGASLSSSGGTFTIPTVTMNVLDDGNVTPQFPALVTATLISARGQPLADTLLQVSIMQVFGMGSGLVDFPAATATSPVTTNGAGQVTLTGTSTAVGTGLVFILSAPGINEGQGQANVMYVRTALFSFF